MLMKKIKILIMMMMTTVVRTSIKCAGSSPGKVYTGNDDIVECGSNVGRCSAKIITCNLMIEANILVFRFNFFFFN